MRPTLMNDTSAFIKEAPKRSLVLLNMRGHREKALAIVNARKEAEDTYAAFKAQPPSKEQHIP